MHYFCYSSSIIIIIIITIIIVIVIVIVIIIIIIVTLIFGLAPHASCKYEASLKVISTNPGKFNH